ncbi:MAG: cbb3-type cytochrome c oxidase subunit I [Chloroflexi bacterium]|nr:cbb3-type cytochrome c oxidase subunit I [Chloroflexota bacterium]MBK6711277.1 cbb3-type cytochrome c oxidase subunit I [Chloroflexota bacterium]MBK7915842.1 cbb3-type cytochrome c oxidase subunit I [Chloroflexota bacterium]MBP6803254.1 cbb3-type cytochrome c oxidase subunit I [Chloroflexota bacterium]MBP7590431.1 cbb3-type cytochrome c oxidase subunit I [Chloroflexota bacterium]
MRTLGIIINSAYVRGLIGQAIFTFAGIGLVGGIRSAMGLETNVEPGVVLGAILGVIGFLLFAGVLTDWLKWIAGKKTPLRHGVPEGKPGWSRYLNVDVNHKVIGIQYGYTSILVLLVGGIFALVFRLELAQPGIQLLDAKTYNTLFSAHGIVMIASILLGVGAMTNYLVPLMIGASDMAFPRLNAFSYWVGIPAVVLILSGMVVGGWDTGWVGYPPLSLRAPLGVVLFLMGFYLNGLSSIASSINLLVTVSFMRAKGMTPFRMPIFVWAAVATSLIQFTATQTVGVALTLNVMERVAGLTFFNPTNGGDPVLYQHLFWFYSHPVVYVFVLPGLGIISELLPVFSRKPLFGYKWIALSSLGIAFVGFLVWAHHMFTSGMNDALRIPFMMATMFVAIPTGVKFFSWVATMWEGKLSFETPMLFVLGAISVFLIGGVTGPILGTIPTDLHLHDSYWVVGHFHATMFGGFIFPFFAAIYYWFPKITGRMYKESLGKLHFWLMVPGFWIMSLGQMQIGLLGMRRRIVDYEAVLGVQGTQVLITIAALVIGWSVLIMVYNLVSSARSKEMAVTNPWGSRSPEWQIPYPVPEFNYDVPFEVVGDPYDYGLDGSEYVHTQAAPVPSGD